jgi:outer membrane protein assembly factor BamB
VKRPTKSSFKIGVLGCVIALSACASASTADFSWFDGTNNREAGRAFSMRWVKDLQPAGPYVPVELAAPVAAPELDRVYVGSTSGELFALDAFGKPAFKHVAKAAIEAPVTLDVARGELYATSVDGTVSALDASTGAQRWQVSVEEAISQRGLLSADALYLVTDLNTVVALNRKDGALLWRYRRVERPEGFAIVGHAALALSDRRILAAFGDGVVAALDPGDGRVVWELDTSLDVPDMDETQRYLDVDTTPAIVDGVAYVASFSGGLYGLDVHTGTVRNHESHLKSIAGLTTDGRVLIVSSAELGVLCLELPSLAPLWRRDISQGAPGVPVIAAGHVFVPESQDGLIALDVHSGRERGRLHTAHGITTPPSLAQGQGFVLSNAGRLYAFSYAPR